MNNYDVFKALIEELETRVQHKQLVGWIPPHCPECFGVLSHYAMAQYKLICLKCGNVYEMKLKGKEPQNNEEM